MTAIKTQSGEIIAISPGVDPAEEAERLRISDWELASQSDIDSNSRNKGSVSARNKRDLLLLQSDWTQMPDSPLSPEAVAEWQNYREALRDVSEQSGFPLNIDWPIPPVQV